MNILFLTTDDLIKVQDLYNELFDFLEDPGSVIFFQPENGENPLWGLVDSKKAHPERVCCPKGELLNAVGAKAAELIAGNEEVPRMTLVVLADLVAPIDIFAVLNPLFGPGSVSYEKILGARTSYRFFKNAGRKRFFSGSHEGDHFLTPWS